MSDYKEGMALEKAQRAVLAKAYRREGDLLICDPATLDTPLARVLDHEASVGELVKSVDPDARKLLEDRLSESLDSVLMELRHRTLLVLLDWLCGDRDGALPRKVLKRFYAFARAVSEDHIWRMNQSEIGRLFGESRAAVCEREKQEVEGFMRLWNMRQWIASGGKSSAARKRFSREKNGNHCRMGGKKVARLFRRNGAAEANGHDDDPLRDGDFVKLPGITRADLDAMALEAERKRLAGLCGVPSHKIDLEKSSPPRADIKTKQPRK